MTTPKRACGAPLPSALSPTATRASAGEPGAGRAALGRGLPGAVDARRQPDQSGTSRHVTVVLRDLPARALRARLPAVRSGVPRAVQQLLPGRRRAAPAPAARPDHAADSGRGASAIAPTSTSACWRCSRPRAGDAEIESLRRRSACSTSSSTRSCCSPTSSTRCASIRSRSAYAKRWPIAQVRRSRCAGSATRGGLVELGHDPARRRRSASTTRRRATAPTRAPFEIASRPATYGEFLAFIDDGGYAPARALALDGLGLGAGRPARRRRSTGCATATAGCSHTLQGMVEIDPHTPVCHLSYFEADAFARWSGARLPTELEWELRRARCAAPRGGNFADRGVVPSAAAERRRSATSRCRCSATSGSGPSQRTCPTRGFRPLTGAVGEYNGKFMCNQLVLRGGSCATPPATCARATATSSRRTRSGSSAASRLARDA